jgi:zinc transport system ATP-binding protein
MHSPIVEIDNLSFRYESEPILHGLSLTVSSGDYLSVVGSNGCGKSTLVRLILRLLPAQAGVIKVSTKRIGYIPQRKDSSFESFPITVTELLVSYAKILRVKDAKVKIGQLLEKIGLENHRNALVSTLSGGQFQKLLIARSLLGDPELLILDEPSSGVDMDSQHEIYAMLSKLNSENNMTIIAVEHNIRAAVNNSTHIFHIAAGVGHLCTPQQYLDEYSKENYALI